MAGASSKSSSAEGRVAPVLNLDNLRVSGQDDVTLSIFSDVSEPAASTSQAAAEFGDRRRSANQDVGQSSRISEGNAGYTGERQAAGHGHEEAFDEVNIDTDEDKEEGVNGNPLSVLVQGPDGALYVATESVIDDCDPVKSPLLGVVQTNEEPPMVSVNFAPASYGTADGLEAVHIILPDPPQLETSGQNHIQGVEALLNPQRILLHVRRKRCFIFLVVIGSSFYLAVFFGALVNRDGTGSDIFVDHLAHEMLTSNNIWVAMAYLVLYLSLDMIALAGTLLDNAHLLTSYILIETVFTCISALQEIRPFLIFKIVVIVIAYQVRHGILMMQWAIRRLHSRLTEQPFPAPSRNLLESIQNRPVPTFFPLFRASNRRRQQDQPLELPVVQLSGEQDAQPVGDRERVEPIAGVGRGP